MVGQRRIFFITADIKTPSGGVQIIYKHVQWLSQAGIPAYVLHARPHFRAPHTSASPPIATPKWSFRKSIFRRAATVLSYYINRFFLPTKQWHPPLDIECDYFDEKGEKLGKIGPEDCLVFPETDVNHLYKIAPNNPFVIFNQCAYNTFYENGPLEEITFTNKLKESPYLSRNLQAVICVSENNRNYLSFAFPGLSPLRIHLSVDPALFYNSESKEKKIVFFNRKSAFDANQVMHILQSRMRLQDWNLCCLEGVTHQKVAEELRSAAVYASFTEGEGCCLSLHEAMASGAIVVGTSGYGADEFFHPDFSILTYQGDVLTFAKELERLCLAYEKDEKVRQMGGKAAAFILKNYSQEQEKKELLEIWQGILQRLP